MPEKIILVGFGPICIETNNLSPGVEPLLNQYQVTAYCLDAQQLRLVVVPYGSIGTPFVSMGRHDGARLHGSIITSSTNITIAVSVSARAVFDLAVGNQVLREDDTVASPASDRAAGCPCELGCCLSTGVKGSALNSGENADVEVTILPR